MSGERTFHVDLGDGHYMNWIVDGSEEKVRIGCVIDHEKPGGSNCSGSLTWAPSKFEREHPERLTEEERSRPRWTLETAADETITISPSVLCACGDHGFIRNGKWVRA